MKETKKQMQNDEDKTFEIDNFDLNSVREKNALKLFFIHFVALIIKRI